MYVGGCGGHGVGAGQVGNGPTMAHEVGHALGLSHSPCGGAPRPDPNYPAYEPHDLINTPNASIGEYGFEFQNGVITIVTPTTKDFMSYCNPEWISLYHYQRLVSVNLLTPTTVPVGMSLSAYIDQGREMKPQPLINIIGFLSADEVHIHSVFRLVTRPNFVGGSLTDLVAVLLNEEEKVISSAPVYSFQLKCSGQNFLCGENRKRSMIKAFIPNIARGGEIRICRDEYVLCSEKHHQRQ